MKKIMFTNDDGYDSVALHDFFLYTGSKFPDSEKFLVAPRENKSGVSHAITLGKPVIIREKEKNMYALEGNPADCTMVAYGIFGEMDFVFSGPNFGSNLGQDIIYSGTIAAAREAAMQTIPTLAFSFVDDFSSLQHINYDNWHSFLDTWLIPLVKLANLNKGSIVSVNVANPKSLELYEATLGARHYYNYQSHESGVDYKGKYTAAIQKEGLDPSKSVLEGSDVYYALKGKNVFSVFSTLPKLCENKMKDLQSFIK